MESRLDYHAQSMDEIVFDARNKSYGAYTLRRLYEKHLLKALAITSCAFIFSMYTPKIAKNLGLFADKPAEVLDTTTIVLAAPPSIKPDEPPPPPPPPVEVERPTVRFLEMEAVKKEDVTEEAPPTIEDIKDNDIGDKNVEGEKTDEPPPIVETVTGGDGIDKNKVYEKVEQMPEYVGGHEAFSEFIEENLAYPPDEAADGVQGIAKVYFVVTEEGKVEQVRLAKSSGSPRLDAEAIRLIKMQPKYKPGRQNGVAVKVLCIIPIEFTIE